MQRVKEGLAKIDGVDIIDVPERIADDVDAVDLGDALLDALRGFEDAARRVEVALLPQ